MTSTTTGCTGRIVNVRIRMGLEGGMVSKNYTPLPKGQKVVFVADNGDPYYGVVQRITGNLVTVKATGPLHQAKSSVVGTLAPNSVHVVPRSRVTPVA